MNRIKRATHYLRLIELNTLKCKTSLNNKKNRLEILKHRPRQQITHLEETKTIISIKQVFTQLPIPTLRLRIYSIINREI